jgi:hypothetical protein
LVPPARTSRADRFGEERRQGAQRGVLQSGPVTWTDKRFGRVWLQVSMQNETIFILAQAPVASDTNLPTCCDV